MPVVLIETVIGGLIVFLVTYFLMHWKELRPHQVPLPPQRVCHPYRCQITLNDHCIVGIAINGTEDEMTCKAICNVIDKALLAWSVEQARD